ncbi:MAG: cation diffusion facilitator family transporter [Pseudomonadota bacterium]
MIPTADSPLARRAAIASVVTAVFLGALKAYAAWRTESVAMLASLADSLLDLVASLVTLGGVHWAAQPADRHHRFGHGKAEALAALFQVAMIAISAFAILLRAIERLVDQRASEQAAQGIGVSVVAIVATVALTAYQRSVLRRTRSIAVATDHLHYQSDVFLNLAVIAALALDGYAGVHGADPLFGIAIALWLLRGAWRAAVQAINELMDREWPEEKRRRFLAVASSGHPALKGIHDLRTRTSGTTDFAQFHIWLAPGTTIAAAHDVTDALEARIARDFPEVEVLIHVDPEGHVDQPGNPLVEADVSIAAQEKHA